MSAATEATTRRICDQSLSIAGMRGDALLSHLSPRQMQVAYFVAIGAEDCTIAVALGVSTQTVRVHCHRIYQRLGLSGGNLRVQLARAVWIARGV